MGKAKRQKKRDDPTGGPKQVVPSKSGAKQWMLLLGASIVLGFVYNSINPAGIEKEASSYEAIESKAVSSLTSENSEPPLLSEVLPYHHEGEINADGFPVVTWAQVQKLSAEFGALLVDARPQWAFDAGHLPKSVCLPSSVEMTPAYTEFSENYPRNRHIVVYCSDLACGRSRDLAVQLRDEFGFTSLLLYEGGYKDYLTNRQ
jgi:rhodanese-related sulfurtransferase